VTQLVFAGQIITLKRALSASFYTCRNMNVKSSFEFLARFQAITKNGRAISRKLSAGRHMKLKQVSAAYGTKLVLEMKIATLLRKSCDKRAELSAHFG
jgi:hypothetical protein